MVSGSGRVVGWRVDRCEGSLAVRFGMVLSASRPGVAGPGHGVFPCRWSLRPLSGGESLSVVSLLRGFVCEGSSWEFQLFPARDKRVFPR